MYSIDKEEQFIVLLALYILRELGEDKPQKKKVLRFIKKRKLVKIVEGDEDIRTNGEEKWMNDFSWARQDNKEKGYICMPEIGIWSLTDKGKEEVVNKAKKWVRIYTEKPETREPFIKGCRRMTNELFETMLFLGSGYDICKVPNKSWEATRSLERGS